MRWADRAKVSHYDYARLEAEAREGLRALEGQLLTKFLVQIVGTHSL